MMAYSPTITSQSSSLHSSNAQQHQHQSQHLQQQQPQHQSQPQHNTHSSNNHNGGVGGGNGTQAHITNHNRLPQMSKQRFCIELSKCLFDFVIQLLPTAEEMAVKEDVRKLLERLIRTIEPDSRLLSFGSTANGFSLRNSDMDLCCLIDSGERLSATDLVTMLGDLLERETKFHVKPLPHARIPIVKLSLDPSPGLPLGIACDIGFENRLALENTRLLMCYAMIDPTRVRTMVLFLKVWSKRRKINSPYKGTLSSYGYVLLVIYFLVHVKNPPVLPNLQKLPPLRPISEEDTHLNGNNIWFFDDIELLRTRWHSENTESIAELLTDFFRYFSKEFLYNTGVASIREGLLTKESKGWQNDLSGAGYNDVRERNRFCIEDPFEVDFNVARCVTRDGLYTIRGEFMRAGRIIAARPERALVALGQLCEERCEDLVAPPLPKLAPLPPQTPYNIGSRSRNDIKPDSLSPPTQFYEPGPQLASPSTSTSMSGPGASVTTQEPPEHMAPKRSKWTSPPPPEAPSSELSMFESSLGIGLELATGSTNAREKERQRVSANSSSHANSQDASYRSESSNSEKSFDTDDDELVDADVGESDDVCSVQSYTEGSSRGVSRRGSWMKPPNSAFPGGSGSGSGSPSIDPPTLRLMTQNPGDALPQAGPLFRGRFMSRNAHHHNQHHQNQHQNPHARNHERPIDSSSGSTSRMGGGAGGMTRAEYNRRSWSGPPRSWNMNPPLWTVYPPSVTASHGLGVRLPSIDSETNLSLQLGAGGLAGANGIARSRSQTSREAGSETNLFYQTAAASSSSPGGSASSTPRSPHAPANGAAQHFAQLLHQQQQQQAQQSYQAKLSNGAHRLHPQSHSNSPVMASSPSLSSSPKYPRSSSSSPKERGLGAALSSSSRTISQDSIGEESSGSAPDTPTPYSHSHPHSQIHANAQGAQHSRSHTGGVSIPNTNQNQNQPQVVMLDQTYFVNLNAYNSYAYPTMGGFEGHAGTSLAGGAGRETGFGSLPSPSAMAQAQARLLAQYQRLQQQQQQQQQQQVSGASSSRGLQAAGPSSPKKASTASVGPPPVPPKTTATTSIGKGSSSSSPPIRAKAKAPSFLVPDETSSSPPNSSSSTSTLSTALPQSSSSQAQRLPSNTALPIDKPKEGSPRCIAPTPTSPPGSVASASVSTNGSISPTLSLSSFTTSLDLSRSPSPDTDHPNQRDAQQLGSPSSPLSTSGPLMFGSVASAAVAEGDAQGHVSAVSAGGAVRRKRESRESGKSSSNGGKEKSKAVKETKDKESAKVETTARPIPRGPEASSSIYIGPAAIPLPSSPSSPGLPPPVIRGREGKRKSVEVSAKDTDAFTTKIDCTAPKDSLSPGPGSFLAVLPASDLSATKGPGEESKVIVIADEQKKR